MQCQMYFCKDYGIPFQGGVRINNISLQKLSPPSFANPAPRSVRSISFSIFCFRHSGKGYLLIYLASSTAEERFLKPY